MTRAFPEVGPKGFFAAARFDQAYAVEAFGNRLLAQVPNRGHHSFDLFHIHFPSPSVLQDSFHDKFVDLFGRLPRGA